MGLLQNRDHWIVRYGSPEDGYPTSKRFQNKDDALTYARTIRRKGGVCPIMVFQVECIWEDRTN